MQYRKLVKLAAELLLEINRSDTAKPYKRFVNILNLFLDDDAQLFAEVSELYFPFFSDFC